MLTHEKLVEELMNRPSVKSEVERLELEEGALLDKQIQAYQADASALRERMVFLSKQLANTSI